MKFRLQAQAGPCSTALFTLFYFFRIHPLAAGEFRKKMLSSRRNLLWVSIFYSLLEATQSTENRTLPQTPEPIFYKTRRKTSAATNIVQRLEKQLRLERDRWVHVQEKYMRLQSPGGPDFIMRADTMSQSLNYDKALTCMKDVITSMRKHGAEM